MSGDASSNVLPCILSSCSNVDSAEYDSIVLVASSISNLTGQLEILKEPLQSLKEIDHSLESSGGVLAVKLPAKRLIYAPTGPLNRDYDDVRRFQDAAGKGIKRALSAGSKHPLLVVVPYDGFKNATLVGILGALEVLHVPLQYREDVPEKKRKIQQLGILGANKKLLQVASAFESGRYVARDIGGADPERMTPIGAEKYVENLFAGTCVKVEVVSDENVLEKEYPLFAAVNRAASVIDRHKGRILYLSYKGEGPITQTLYLVGKGVTYDTGGADIKAGGVMAGMSRDKCGAAAVAGFFQVLATLKPKGVKAEGGLAMVRNSVGENCYVADEIITSRAGKRVRIGNTDAEGRMAMADVLCKFKEMAVGAMNPYLMTIATLTGHAVLAAGEGYSLIMDNGPAKLDRCSQKMQDAGEAIGDTFELSSIRREDYSFHAGKAEGEDLLQCNNLPSSRTPRGHQTPAAFLIMASGLDKHGKNSEKPLKYSHLDIAASAGDVPNPPTGAPILALATNFLNDQL